MDTLQLIVDTAEKIFSDHCDKQLLDAAETGSFSEGLWSTVTSNGFHLLGQEASGTTAQDMYGFIKQCGRYAVPLPLAETMLVNLWQNQATQDTPASIGELVDNEIIGVSWGRVSQRVIGIAADSMDIVVVDNPQIVRQATNMAGEPRDVIAVPGDAARQTLTEDPFAQVALCHINLMAGCLNTVLDLGLQFAEERSQFGRSISKFQAIQHSLAVVAAEVAAAQRAADAAVDALGTPRFVYEVAAAKSRVGEAVGVVAEQVHQIHGAMGFTHEHQLHHYTRRVWAWRDEWGNEFYWQALLGQHLAQLGADQVWDFIATRG